MLVHLNMAQPHTIFDESFLKSEITIVVNNTCTKWFTTKLEYCYLSIEQCTVYTLSIDNKISSVLLTSLSTFVEKIAGLKVKLGLEIEEWCNV